jgi:hypothetical protein
MMNAVDTRFVNITRSPTIRLQTTSVVNFGLRGAQTRAQHLVRQGTDAAAALLQLIEPQLQQT